LDHATKDFAGRRGDGRRHDRILLPVGFRTFCELTGANFAPEIGGVWPGDLQSRRARDAFDELSFWTEELHQSWINYLRVGGFPQAIRELRDTGDAEMFAGDLWDVIEGEALIEAGMTSAQMSGLLESLVEGLTNPFNASRIQRTVGFTTNSSVYERLFSLEQAYLIWLCHQDDEFRPKLGAFRKVYFLDPLLSRALAHRNPVFAHPDQSKLVEQQVGLALLRAIRIESGMNLDSSELLLYRRTKSKAEIDFVSQFLSSPVEVKYVDSGWARAAQTLRANFDRGVVATRRSSDTKSDVWVVPVANLAWLLDTAQLQPPQIELPGFGV
jgi:predicted AAA+ superfamily ATPase